MCLADQERVHLHAVVGRSQHWVPEIDSAVVDHGTQVVDQSLGRRAVAALTAHDVKGYAVGRSRLDPGTRRWQVVCRPRTLSPADWTNPPVVRMTRQLRAESSSVSI